MAAHTEIQQLPVFIFPIAVIKPMRRDSVLMMGHRVGVSNVTILCQVATSGQIHFALPDLFHARRIKLAFKVCNQPCSTILSWAYIRQCQVALHQRTHYSLCANLVNDTENYCQIQHKTVRNINVYTKYKI